MSWDSANRHCVNRGMNLATFDSNDEAKYFESVSTTNVWVGVRDFDENNRFEKVTDGKSVESFLQWCPGEPNRTGERCVVSYVIAPFVGFNDNHCHINYSLSCEFVETVNF
jgi:Lectin C-type domain